MISSPMEKKIKDAYKQTESTNIRLHNKYKLGLIYLNSGYMSIPYDLFCSELKRYIGKHNLQFDEIITLSVSGQTNGFDSYIEFYFEPVNPLFNETKKLQEAWNNKTEEIMTQLVRGELNDFSKPQRPVAFSHSGIDFYWLPYAIERFQLGNEK
jgi:hypothetical protein